MNFLLTLRAQKIPLLSLIHTTTNENQQVDGKLADRCNYDAVKFNEEYNVAVRTRFKLELEQLSCHHLVFVQIYILLYFKSA